ncbi:MAG: glycogen debranching protein GlgX, partial [Pseudomonadota bacterium]|nr:glycogen debranching protein GlgX [Pseudomonadota bacterium]
HVKGFTQRHPGVPEAARGKYLGLASPAVTGYLRSLGVTSVELLPCQAFATEPHLERNGLSNYWGYNSVAWFAPANEYAVDDAVLEFKAMVKGLHAADIEVILDVVFNHTAEGGEAGPTLNFKGLDNAVYYRMLPDQRHYDNLSGCGNTVNCSHPRVRALIIDCLKYWVEEMHVDGFRFDLATVLARDDRGYDEHSAFFSALRAEPVLRHVKLIAEPWDVGPGGYQLGRFPAGWAEWNDRYRDTLRSFWRGDAGKVGELAERCAGSSDIFNHDGRLPTASINYVTAHDGFTLNDLVTYSHRHNFANLENNMDGPSHNLSWNCGVEGVTEDAAVRALRDRQMRNCLATLLLSQGVPMLQGGDEFARTQRGNNNAYCQDNDISWVDWDLCMHNADLVNFVRMLTGLRREFPEFRRERFFNGHPTVAGARDVVWLRARGTEMTEGDWLDPQLRGFGMLLSKHQDPAGKLLLLTNAAADAQSFELPPAGRAWSCRFDTARDGADAPLPVMASRYLVAAHSAVLLEC